MDKNTELNSGKSTDNNAFVGYSDSMSVMPKNMKTTDATPRAVGKTSAPHQLGHGHGVSTTGE